MINREEILAAAKAAPAKVRLEEHREAVMLLREKGFTWREIAEFLTEKGIPIDHTRVYRMFGEPKRERRTDSREIEIHGITFVGEKLTKRKKTWNVLELEMPSKLGSSITLLGYAWGSGMPKFELGPDDAIQFRTATLVTRSGNNGFPTAYVAMELLFEENQWTALDVYLVPKWETIL